MEPTKIPNPTTLERMQKIVDQQIQIGRLGVVDCIDCGITVSHLKGGYKCLYCTAWLCTRCAELHFGKTRSQFYHEISKDPRRFAKHD